jgi:hypothetical protein
MTTTFWVYDIKQLFSSLVFIPGKNKTLNQQLNAITRLLIIICLIISYFDVSVAIAIFIFYVGLIIYIYLNNANNVSVEPFKFQSRNFKIFTQPVVKEQDIVSGNNKETQLDVLNSEYEVTKQNISNANKIFKKNDGIGFSRQAYVDTVTGCLKYNRSDIDVETMSRVITKSKIDTTPDWNNNAKTLFKHVNSDYKKINNDYFISTTNSYRKNLQESMMQKNNAVIEQRRLFPISTNGRK